MDDAIVRLNFDFSPAWYALYTRHQHEKVVATILSEGGFEIFLPLYTAVRRWKDRAKQLSLPLFPCYVFLRARIVRREEIWSIPGVNGFVEFAGKPALIPEREIQTIRQVLDRNSRIEPHPFLKCGDWVRVKSGALEGIEGILVRKKNLSRLVLSVEVLGKSASVEVDASLVESVKNRPLKHPILEVSCRVPPHLTVPYRSSSSGSSTSGQYVNLRKGSSQ